VSPWSKVASICACHPSSDSDQQWDETTALMMGPQGQLMELAAAIDPMVPMMIGL
jgi:hypothetical protein